MKKYFNKALPIFPKQYVSQMNVSVLFTEDFSFYKNVTLTIAGEIEYQIFLNGELVGYGPAKAAHNYHRVSEYEFANLQDKNRIVIILASYLVQNFDRINEPPFIQYELKSDDKVIAYSNLDTNAYLYKPRYQKVTRFSYQRAFSESYNSSLTNDIFNHGSVIRYPKLELVINEYGELIDRNINYLRLDEAQFELKEKDKVYTDENIDIYQDRYMYNQGIGIFDKNDWEVDPNKVVSQLVHKKIELDNNVLQAKQSLAYEYKISVTGLIKLDVDVLEDSELYVYFDEISESEDMIDFKFFRNTSHNIVSYELKKGHYQLLSFSPYTAKFLRVTNLKGECVVNSVSMVLVENPDSYRLEYELDDKKLKLIFDGARNTFASNAFDVLTDCPSRERAGWLCDGYFTGRVERLFTGYNLVENNFLENYALYKYHGDVEKGMLPMCYPADFFNNEMYIPNWAMLYGVELHSLLSREHNPELLQKSIHNLLDLIQFFKKYENEDGLLEDLENWVFVEWSPANDKESIAGVNIPSNALYSYFLQCVGELLNDQSLIEKVKHIKQKIREIGFNGEFFVDNLIRNEKGELKQNNRIGEVTQYYMFYFGIITKEEYPDLFNKMVTKFGPNRDLNKVYPHIYKSNAFIGNFLRLEILLRHQLYEEALKESVDYFYKMVIRTGTIWEHDFFHGSLNHGFASFAANVIFEALTGIYKIDYENNVIYMHNANSNHKYLFKIPVKDKFFIVKKEKEVKIMSDGFQIVKEGE